MKYLRPEELGPCPECRGPRALFECETTETAYRVYPRLYLGAFKRPVSLYACTCLVCGATTLRPDPEETERIREAAEKQFLRH